MRTLRILAAAGLVLLLSACANPMVNAVAGSLFGASVATSAPQTVAAGEKVLMNIQKGLTVGHLAYNFVGEELIKNAAPGGLLHGANAATAQHVFDVAGDALNAADTAEKAVEAVDSAANAPGFFAALSKLQDAYDNANLAISQASAAIHPTASP